MVLQSELYFGKNLKEVCIPKAPPNGRRHLGWSCCLLALHFPRHTKVGIIIATLLNKDVDVLNLTRRITLIS